MLDPESHTEEVTHSV